MRVKIAIAVSIALLLGSAAPGLTSRALAYRKGEKKAQPKKRRPALDYNKYGRTRKVDIQMAEKRKAIRDQIQTLLSYEKDDKERPTLLYRLAENYFEEAEAYFNQAQELDVQLARDPTNASLRRRIGREKGELKKVENRWRGKAIDMYKSIASEHPNYPARDQVLFYLGYSLWDMERYKEALAVYKEMITAYPASRYVPDAYFRFGEYYFDSAKLEKALMAYKKVAEYTESDIYVYALYKQGWCYFNLHEWAKAKDMFQSVVELSDMGEGSIEVRKEALDDFTLTYSHEGSAEAAPRVFKRMAPKTAHRLLVSLANMYFADGKDKKAVILYRYLIKAVKCSAEVPFYQGRIVDAASRVGDKRYTVNQVRELVRRFKDATRCVKRPNAKQKERIREARELAEVTLRKLAGTWYKEARETKQTKTFEYAQELFGDYLELFPDSKDAYDMRFAYAELLSHRLGRFERAAAEYTKIVVGDLAYLKKHKRFPRKKVDPKKGEPSPPGTYFCDAAYKAMQANREIMKKERRKERKRKSATRQEKASRVGEGKAGKVAKKPIPKYKRRFIQSAEIYLDHCPKDEDILDVKYDIAKTYYDYYHLGEAIQRFDEIVRDFPDSELANYAANLVLDAFSERRDLDKLNQYARKYFKNGRLMKNAKLRTFLGDLIPKIAFQRIAAMEDKPRPGPGGKRRLSKNRIRSKVAYAYIKFWREFPRHELADEALFNAGAKYEQAERLDKARKARQLLIDEYPKSNLVPGTIFNLAENYERLADFNSAADLYERYADTYQKMKGLGKAVSYEKGRRGKRGKKKEKNKQKKKQKKEKRFEGNRRTWNLEDAEVALLNAGIYREALHQFRRAIADRIKFVDLFPNSKDAPQVFFSLGLLYERMGNHAKAADVFGTYSERYQRSDLDRAIAAHMRRASMLRKLRRPNWKEIDREVQTTIKLYNRHKRRRKKAQLRESAEAEAHAVFIQAESFYKDYIRYRFTVPRKKGPNAQQKHLQAQLKEKIRLLEKIRKVYTGLAKRKQPEWTIASLYKLGRAYENFAETFYRAPQPRGLTPEQIDLYRGMLREQGRPHEDKAVVHFKAAVEKGSELGFYSRYTQLALAKLQHYRPAEYPREKLGFELGVISDPASRNPLLLAFWDEAKKKPELLDEPPLTTKREREAVPVERPKASTLRPGPKKTTGQTARADAAARPEAKEAKPAEQGQTPQEPADPATAVSDEEEPEDEFD